MSRGASWLTSAVGEEFAVIVHLGFVQHRVGRGVDFFAKRAGWIGFIDACSKALGQKVDHPARRRRPCGRRHRYSLNRAPSDQRWEEGDVLSLDSGGNYHGYIGDVARMGIIGEPDAELVDLLAEVEAVEQASMKPIRPGALGKEIYAAANAVLHKSKVHNHSEFLAHGMELVSHEAPRLTNSGPVPYDAYDADRPLETGMVISVETTLQHPQRGFIKLEDTVVVTPKGFEVYGDRIRGWNRAGS